MIADLIERLSSPAALPVTQAAMWAERKQAADALRSGEEELAERRMNLAQAAEALRAAEAEVASKKDVIDRLRGAASRLGPWLAAALDDPGTCDEMKSAIVAWFEAL